MAANSINITIDERFSWIALTGSILVSQFLLYSDSPQSRYSLILGLALILLLFAELALIPLYSSLAQKIRVSRRAIGDPVEGSRITIEILATNPFRAVPVMVTVEDNPPEMLGGGVARYSGPYSKVITSKYNVKARVGRHCFRATRLSLKDPLGLVRVSIQKKAGGLECLEVEPTLDTRIAASLIEVAGISVAEASHTVKGLEFYGLKEYSPGDDLRLIEWAATARFRRLIIKDLRGGGDSAFKVAFIASESAYSGVEGESDYEVLARAAYSISHRLMRAGYSLEFLYVKEGELGVSRLSPGEEPRRVAKIIASIEPLDRRYVEEALIAGAGLLTPPRGSYTILLIEDAELASLAGLWGIERVIVLTPSAVRGAIRDAASGG